jgi:protein tyrosine phosphatase
MKAVDSKQTGEVDIFHTVYQLRRDRRYMVQTRAQYEFVYRYDCLPAQEGQAVHGPDQGTVRVCLQV